MAEDPVSPLVLAAVQFHEIFSAYVAGGFTPAQALHMLGVALGEMMKSAGGG